MLLLISLLQILLMTGAKSWKAVLFQLLLKLKQCKNKPHHHPEIFTTIVRNVFKLNTLSIPFSNATSKSYVGGFGEILKEHNSLYHPLARQGDKVDSGYYNPIYGLTASLEIGNQVIPSQEIQGVREAYVHLMHCAETPMLVRSEDYKTQAFMFGFNLEKIE